MKKDEPTIYINALNDFGFKRTFMNKEIIIAFLNCFLGHLVPRIVDVTFRPNEHLGRDADDKRIITDLECTDERGNRFVVEMQRLRQSGFIDRVLVYAGTAITEQARKGERTYHVDPVYCFSLLDFEPEELKGTDGFYHVLRFSDPEGRVVLPQATLCFLALSRFEKKLSSPEEWDALSEQAKWAYALKHSTEFGDPEFAHVDGIFARLKELCEISKLNDMEKQEYKKSVLEYADVQDAMRCSFEDGEKEGLQKGMQQGALTIAKNMKVLGVPVASIAQYTGLTVEQIDGLEATTVVN